MTESTESAVIIPVPVAELAVGAHRARFDPSAAWGVPAHVTVLYPFVPPSRLGEGVFRTLEVAVRAVPRFQADFAEVGRFDDDVLWLGPDPAAPFRSLTEAVHRSFPHFPPYGGAYNDLAPHLTVASQATAEEMEEIERELPKHLPITLEVTHARVMCGAHVRRSWRTVRDIPLG